MTDAAAVTTTTGTDVVRSLTFVVLIQTVVSHNDHGDTGEHDHHSATNVWTTSRNRDFCTSGEQRCYNTGQCCPGFVCAASHQQAMGRELTGACIKLDRLHGRCGEDEDCKVCTSDHCQSAVATNVRQKPKHGLGSSCGDSSQCHALTDDRVSGLCCQDVHRGRQGTKRMCDRITPLSVCLVDYAVLH